MQAAVLTIGNEILKGKTVNTNAAHIGRVLTFSGHTVVLGLTVRDVREEIVWGFRTASQFADIVVSTGGLGPTFDDMTSSSFAEALGLPLVENPEAMEMIRSRLTARGLEMTENRRKMAMMPQGARAIRNLAGTAPGIYLEAGGKKYLVTPGVPDEMRSVLENAIELIADRNVRYAERSTLVRGIMESSFAPHVDEVMKMFAGRVYIKSHPRPRGPRGPEIELEVSASGQDPEGDVEGALRELERRAASMGGEYSRI